MPPVQEGEKLGGMKILIVQTGFLGDLVLSTPLISRVLKACPGAEIWMLVADRAKGLLENDPRIKGIIETSKSGARVGKTLQLAKELRSHKFVCALTPHRSLRTAIVLRLARIPRIIGFKGRSSTLLYTESVPYPKSQHAAERNQRVADPLSQTTANEPLALYPRPLPACSAELRGLIGTPYVVISPGSAWLTKRWPPERYAELAAKLVEIGHKVVLVGSPGERALTEQIAKQMPVVNLAGKMPLDEVITLVANAKMLVCNDSMILHIGSAVKTPTVAIFCATTESMGFGPWQNPSARVVERTNLSCKPCGRHGGNHCPTGTHACMLGVGAEEVQRAVEGALNVR